MFTAENEDVLVQFQALCEQYPRENVVALWEMAGGKLEAAQRPELVDIGDGLKAHPAILAAILPDDDEQAKK